MEPCVSLPILTNSLIELTQTAKDWALLHGVGMRSTNNFSLETITFTPFTLIPTSFPRQEFEKAVKIQIILNELTHKIAYDDEFLRKTLSSTIKADEFTARLFEIYDTVQKEGFAQKVSLGLFRSDYLLDEPKLNIKQVEFNTISCSFGPLTSILPKWHKYVLHALDHGDQVENIPNSGSLQGYANGLLAAWKIYNRQTAGILFVIEETTYNISDQRLLEFEIQEQIPKIKIIRKTLTQIAKLGKLDEKKRLFIENIEIGVIYFRSAYAPSFYPSEVEWDGRLLMERSISIKSPSIQYQLAGTKKIQQELSLPGVLERFISCKQHIIDVREIFTGLFSIDMDDPKGEETIDMAIKNPFKYVLKPQREGGGNNIYDDEVKIYLEKFRNSTERNGWILMEKINPPIQKNYMLRPGLIEPIFTDMISELGIFGVIIGDSDDIITNVEVGHMLRTKVSSANEGGVSAGSGALDSVFLI